MANARFTVDTGKCTGCGLCLNVCPGNMVGGDVLRMEDGHPRMVSQTRFGWQGCWRCQHCLAVCPAGAISILGVSPEEVSDKPGPAVREDLPKLMRYRRTCRAFAKRDVDPQLIDEILDTVSAVPTGGNNQRLHFSVVSSREAMQKVFDAVFVQDGLKPDFPAQPNDGFSALRIYDAPCLFIAHKETSKRFHDGDAVEINLATAYFELLANANGLGTVISTYSAELLSKSPSALRLLGIPENHQFMTVVGFGYPKYQYARGVKKTRNITKLS